MKKALFTFIGGVLLTLGISWTGGSDLEAIEESLNESKGYIEELVIIVDNQENEINNLNSEIINHQSNIAYLNGQLEIMKDNETLYLAEIAELEARVADYEAEIVTLKSQIISLEIEITDLNNQITDLQAEVEQLLTENSRLENELKKANNETAATRERVDAIMDQIRNIIGDRIPVNN